MKKKLASIAAMSLGAAYILFFGVYAPLQAHINDWMGW